MITYSDISKTVYSLVYPETRALMQEAFTQHADQMLARHDAPHLKMQDAYGPDFARQWWAWAGFDNPDQWKHFYPTNGASEALREIINELTRHEGTLVVFEGEYEGYQAIAQGNGTHVVTLDRLNWKEQWDMFSSHITTPTQVWLSNPSSIDGNYWPEFQEFCQYVQHPLVEVWVDLTYIGACPPEHHQHVDVSPSTATGCVFSLSKPAGMYYRRIGGCFSTRPIAGLYGNQWFKNLDSMFLGSLFMERFARGELPKRYQHLQTQSIDTFNRFAHDWMRRNHTHAPLWQPSHVVLLAHAYGRPAYEHMQEDMDRFKRGKMYRACVTPSLSKLLGQP